MRWLVGWSSIAASFGTAGRVSGQGPGHGPGQGPGQNPGRGPGQGGYGHPYDVPPYGDSPHGGIADADHPDDLSPDAERTVHPVGAQLLWGDPDPLWAVGDWRPDEIRTVTADPADPFTRLAVLGCCGATDAQLRRALYAARGGALRHLTEWSGSYTAVVQAGRRITVLGDLAGARPVFYTPGPAAPPTPPPRCPSPTSSRHSSTSATSPPCWPAPTAPRHWATAHRTSASAASRPGTP